MISGTHRDMKHAIKRLKHFRALFPHDGPFTSLTPFGRNLALFYDCADKPDYLGDFVLCAGSGRVLAERCDTKRIAEDEQSQADIAAWWWRANEHLNWEVLNA